MTPSGRGILRPMQELDGPPRAADDPDAALVERARRAERGAFDALVARHTPRVWAVVWRIVRRREDAEDVVQETFLAAHRALGGFRGDAAFSTWLHRIAVSRALNHVGRAGERAMRAAVPLEGDGLEGTPRGVRAEVEAAAAAARANPTPLHALEARDLMRRLAACLDLLPPAWRAVLALRDVESLSYEEIAEFLTIALGTVRSRLARARAALKDCIEGKAA